MSSKYSCCGDVPYEYVVKFLQKLSEQTAKTKEKYVVQFLQMCVPRCTPDIFQIFRLLLPNVRGQRWCGVVTGGRQHAQHTRSVVEWRSSAVFVCMCGLPVLVQCVKLIIDSRRRPLCWQRGPSVRTNAHQR